MSTPAGDRATPLRPIGVALVALAVVLAGVGLLTRGSDDAPVEAAGAPTSSTAPTPTPTPSTAPATTTPPPTTPTPTTPVPTTPAPTTAVPTTAAPTTPPPADPRDDVDVVVLNNSTVPGLAARAAADVRTAGWTVAEVGNFTGLVPTTTAYYRPGTAQESAARALADDTGARVEPRFDGLPATADGVVLVVTVDYAG